MQGDIPEMTLSQLFEAKLLHNKTSSLQGKFYSHIGHVSAEVHRSPGVYVCVGAGAPG